MAKKEGTEIEVFEAGAVPSGIEGEDFVARRTYGPIIGGKRICYVSYQAIPHGDEAWKARGLTQKQADGKALSQVLYGAKVGDDTTEAYVKAAEAANVPASEIAGELDRAYSGHTVGAPRSSTAKAVAAVNAKVANTLMDKVSEKIGRPVTAQEALELLMKDPSILA